MVDGKWERFEDTNARPDGLSYDGSRELVQSYPNTLLLDCGNKNEEAMSNLCMRTAATHGYEYLLQVASDEYIEGDYFTFQKRCDVMAKRYPDIHCFFVHFNVIHITPPEQKYQEVMRLIHNPMFVRLRDAHWIYYFNDRPVPTNNPKRLLISGMTIHHDDSARKPEREIPMLEYQLQNVPRENRLKWQKIVKGEYDEKIDLVDINVLKMILPDNQIDWFLTPDDQYVYLIRGNILPDQLNTIKNRVRCKSWKINQGWCVLPIFKASVFPNVCPECNGTSGKLVNGVMLTCEHCMGLGSV